MAATNEYSGAPLNWNSPPSKFEAVTAHDTNDLTYVCRAIYNGSATAANIAAVAVDGTVALHKNVPAGSYIIGLFKRVNATNTTATDMIAVR